MPSMEKPLAQMSIPESQKKENVPGKSFPNGFSSNSPVFFFFFHCGIGCSLRQDAFHWRPTYIYCIIFKGFVSNRGK